MKTTCTEANVTAAAKISIRLAVVKMARHAVKTAENANTKPKRDTGSVI